MTLPSTTTTSRIDDDDPSDWPSQELKDIDVHLRCSICFEYFKAPLTLPCMHSFCSLCLRSCFTDLEKKECPSCRTTCDGGIIKAKSNRLLEDLVMKWSAFRSYSLQKQIHSIEKKSQDHQTTTTSIKNINSKKEHHHHRFEEKTPKRSSPYTVIASAAPLTSPRRSTRSTNNAAVLQNYKSHDPKQLPDDLLSLNCDFIIEEEEYVQKDQDFTDEIYIKKPKSHSVNSKNGNLPSSPQKQTTPQTPKSTTTLDNSEFSDYQVQDAKASVECPMCSKHVLANFINQHIDSICISHIVKHKSSTHSRLEHTPISKPTDILKKQHIAAISNHSVTTPSKTHDTRKPIPAVGFSLMKDQQLRNKLKELGLSTVGTRQALQKRFTEYRNMYNANLDSAYPKSDSEIKSLFMKQEKQNNQSNGSDLKSSLGMVFDDPNHKVSETDELAKKRYLQNNKDSFQELIEQARLRKMKKTKVESNSY